MTMGEAKRRKLAGIHSQPVQKIKISVKPVSPAQAALEAAKNKLAQTNTREALALIYYRLDAQK